MSNGIYVALSGAMAQSTALDVASNNIANANTTGYHAERMRFQQVLSKAKDSKFVAAQAGVTDNTPGTSTQTGNPLDAAIQGDGYFVVRGANNTQRYTRDGSFRLDGKGQLTTSDGHLVLDAKTNKPLVVPPDAGPASLAPDGTLSAGDQQIGQVKMVKLDPKTMQREGASLFSSTGKPLKGDAPTVAPGSIESANFNVVHGIVDLVRVSRNYEALHKMIESYKDMDSEAAKMASEG